MRKTIGNTIIYITTAAAYSLLAYKLTVYPHYNELFNQIFNSTANNIIPLIATLLLMPINLLTESLKWRYSISLVEQVSVKQAFQSTLAGQVAAFVTPNRLGDFPARTTTLDEENRLTATLLGYISSWAQTIIIIIVGIIGSGLYLSNNNDTTLLNTRYFALAATVATGILAITISLPYISRLFGTKSSNRYILKAANILAMTTPGYIAKLLLFSAIRYSIFCTQLFLMLHFCHIRISPLEGVASIPVIYLLASVTPTITASEAATKSSYAIVILGSFGAAAPMAALATTLTWAINCGIPLLVGGLFFKLKSR